MKNGRVRTTGKAVHVGLHLPKNTAILRDQPPLTSLSLAYPLEEADEAVTKPGKV